MRVAADHFGLQVRARGAALTLHAAHDIGATMQVDHVPAASRLVQAVDVLSHHLLDSAAMLERSERTVGRIRLCVAQPLPADEAARPVTFARVLMGHEILERHRLGALPFAVGVAVIRNSGAGATACAREHEQPLVPVDEFAQFGCHRRRRRSHGSVAYLEQ